MKPKIIPIDPHTPLPRGCIAFRASRGDEERYFAVRIKDSCRTCNGTGQTRLVVGLQTQERPCPQCVESRFRAFLDEMRSRYLNGSFEDQSSSFGQSASE